MRAETIYVSNDNILWVKNLYDHAPTVDAYENSATVTVTVTDAQGNNVSGQSWPATLTYLTSSNGTYYVTLEDGLSLSAGRTYYAEVSVDGGSDKIGFFKRELKAKERTT